LQPHPLTHPPVLSIGSIPSSWKESLEPAFRTQAGEPPGRILRPPGRVGAITVSDKCRLLDPSGQDDFHGKIGNQGQFTAKIGYARGKIHWTSSKMECIGLQQVV
jgi:hypothetical protein